MSTANRSCSASASAWKTRPAPTTSRNSSRAIVRWPANATSTVRMATSAWAIGSVSAATARSTLPTSLSAVVRISSRKIDSLVGKWK